MSVKTDEKRAKYGLLDANASLRRLEKGDYAPDDKALVAYKAALAVVWIIESGNEACLDPAFREACGLTKKEDNPTPKSPVDEEPVLHHLVGITTWLSEHPDTAVPVAVIVQIKLLLANLESRKAKVAVALVAEVPGR